MSWDREPPSTPPPSPPQPARPFAPPGAAGPGSQPTSEVPSPFRPAPTSEGPPPPPPPPPPSAGQVPSAPPAPPTAAGAAGGPPSWGGPPTAPPPLPYAEPPRRPRRALRALAAVVVVLGLFGLGFGARSIADDETRTIVQTPSSISTPNMTIDPGSEPVAAVAQTISPSVVQIETSSGLGSGVVYDTDLIMTNAHVVGSSQSVTVRTADGKAVDGEVVGADTGTDIAVVRAEGLDAPIVSLASDLPSVGQIAVAVGSPYGLDQTVTSGIVSAVNRPVDNDKGVVVNMIQTDASINPGNSGGALANREGQIIGINTAIFSQTGENTGIGFAIPITTAKKAADKLANGETVQKAVLGVKGPQDTPNGDAGAYVGTVAPDSGAAEAGILEGDLIVKVDDVDIRSFNELAGLISSHSPGDVVAVTVDRDGQTSVVEVTLGSG